MRQFILILEGMTAIERVDAIFYIFRRKKEIYLICMKIF